MLMSNMLRDNFLDDFFAPTFGRRYDHSGATDLMRTDIKDTGSGYEMTMSLPGVKKEDVKAELKDGYLTVSAVSNMENDEQDTEGRYIRRERYMGSCSRSFYVGDHITQEEIKARFENGILTLLVPKQEAIPAAEEKKYIAIEG